MAVLSRLLVGSQQRLDLPDVLAIESYVSSDFKNLIKSFVGSRPMILKGFEIIDAPLSINTRSVSIRVANSVLYNPESSAGSFFYGLSEGHPLAVPLVPELRTNATNYVYLTLSSQGYAEDSRAFWDVDLNSGEGGEFNQIVNTQSVLKVEVNVSVSTFPEGTVPVAKIKMGSSTIEEITDCRNMMFRLGSGGVSPDQISTYSFRPLPSVSYTRDEPPITVRDSTLPTPFFGGDKNIFSLKEWMDAVMTKLLELSGTTYWYEASPTINLLNLFDDALSSSIKSKGKWTHNIATPGDITWSEDIIYRKMNDPREIIIRANNTGITLADDQVMFIEMIRARRINSLNTQVTFENQKAYVNGIIGAFADIKQGDWVKKLSDNDNLYLRVEAFRDADNGADGSGSPTSPELAKSIILSGQYQGSDEYSSAVYTKGEYLNSDIQISTRSSTAPWLLGGQFYWLANRSDTIENIENIIPSYLTDVDITNSDGKRAKLEFSSVHGLMDGDRVVVSNAGAYNGTYQVEVESNTVVAIETAVKTNPTNVTVSWAIVTTKIRSSDYGYQLESANHNFESNQTVVIANTGSLYDSYSSGLYKINNRSDTTFQIPYNANTNVGAVGTATCARVNLKTEFGAARVVQGESIDINEPDSANILKFIGMDSLSQSSPVYSVPDDYNTLQGFQNFNSDSSDSLTKRVSKLTSMMADRVQDRESIIGGRVTFRNVGSGSDQLISSTGNLFIEKPGSLQQIINTSSGFTLAANQALVISIGRESSSAIDLTIEDLYSPFLLDENKIILFYRFSNTSVYSWDGIEIKNSSSWTSNDHENAQNKNITVIDKAGISFTATAAASGYIYYNSPTGSVKILINGSFSDNSIDVAAINALSIATRSISNGQSVWIRINRSVSKVFNNIQTNPLHQDNDTNGCLYITDKSQVPVDEDVFTLYALDSLLISTLNHSSIAGNIYEENYEITSTVLVDDEILLPVDSRNNNEDQVYIKGAGQLEVYLNGQRMILGTDWIEPISTPVYSAANKIVIKNQDLVIGDVVTFRIASSGGVYFSEISNFATLQSAYDNGSSVNVSSGDPILLNAGIDTALKVTGKIEVGNVDISDNFNLNVNGTVRLSDGLKSIDVLSGEVRFNESGSSPNYVALTAPDTLASNITLKLPNSSGLSGQILSTDGLGSLVWVDKNPNLIGQVSSLASSGNMVTIDPLVYRSFIAHVSVFVASSNLAETFHIIGSNNGLTWKISAAAGGDNTNVVFSIDANGILSFSDSGSQDKIIKYDFSLMFI